MADTRMIANCWLRPGNTASANNVSAFLDSASIKLAGKRVGLLRADSGFSDNAFLCKLEERKISHIIAPRLSRPLQRVLVDVQGWWTIDEGIDLVSVQHQAPSRPPPRQVVCIRQHINKRDNPKGKTLSLFADDPAIGQHRFGALATNLNLPAQEVWRTCRGRADRENRIKELRCDFAADSFCSKGFWATGAGLTMVMPAHNFTSLFRQVALKHSVTSGGKNIQHTPNTSRLKIFSKAGYIGTGGRKGVLKLAVAMRQRVWFEGGVGQIKILRSASHIQSRFCAVKRANGKSGFNPTSGSPIPVSLFVRSAMSKNPGCFTFFIARRSFVIALGHNVSQRQ